MSDDDEKKVFYRGEIVLNDPLVSGTIIVPDGVDWSGFMDRGYLRGKPGEKVEGIIGVPVKNERTGRGMSVTFEMLPQGFDLPRKVHTSISGVVKKRDGNLIKEFEIRAVNLSANRTSDTYIELIEDEGEPMKKSQLCRAVYHHHDGHGLNEDLEIDCDDRDVETGGGASHYYEIGRGISPEDPGDRTVAEHMAEHLYATIQFQKGPRHHPESTPGITDGALLAVIIDRYLAFQKGPFACRENALVITKLQEALHWMKHRADDRARRDVLGKLEK